MYVLPVGTLDRPSPKKNHIKIILETAQGRET